MLCAKSWSTAFRLAPFPSLRCVCACVRACVLVVSPSRRVRPRQVLEVYICRPGVCNARSLIGRQNRPSPLLLSKPCQWSLSPPTEKKAQDGTSAYVKPPYAGHQKGKKKRRAGMACQTFVLRSSPRAISTEASGCIKPYCAHFTGKSA